MTSYSVVLLYGDDCGFYIHMGRERGSNFIHEFRPGPRMSSWLEGSSMISYRTITDMVGSMEVLSHMEIFFSDRKDAMMFKLAFG